MSKQQPVKDFIDQQFKPYATYDNERSIPSMVDGLKISQRKIIHTVFKTLKDGQEIKVTNLGSASSNETHYKHGEDSIVDAVIGLAQDFAGSNNYPLLEKDGQFGTAIDNGAASPRYIYVKRSKQLSQMFNPNDLNILDYLKFDGNDIEPPFFLPKMPLILLNGGFGIGTGYSSNILPRDPKKVKIYMENYSTGVIPSEDLLLPYFNGFKGTVKRLAPKKFIIEGKLERVSQTITVIRDLPPVSYYQFENYKSKVLLPLLEEKIINEFINESTEGNWNITIVHSRDFGKQSVEKIMDILKMRHRFSETINVWGFDERLKSYDDIVDLMHDWMDNRINLLEKRKTYILSELSEKLNWLNVLINMINHWLVSPDILKKKRPDIEDELSQYTSNPEYIKKFLASDILSLTEERILKIKHNLKEIQLEYQELESKNGNDIMLDDLSTLILDK